jgi:hypothetical protein
MTNMQRLLSLAIIIAHSAALINPICQSPCCIFANEDGPTRVQLNHLVHIDWNCDAMPGMPMTIPNIELAFQSCTPSSLCWLKTPSGPSAFLEIVPIGWNASVDTSQSRMLAATQTIYHDSMVNFSVFGYTVPCVSASTPNITSSFNSSTIIRFFPWWWSAVAELNGIDVSVPNAFCGSVIV